jgi:hypothetical protein
MAACHLRKRTLEVADNDVNDGARQEVYDSAVVVGKDTLAVVTNNDNDSLRPAHIEDMLPNVLCALSCSQSPNEKANELGANLMTENRKLADRLTEKLQHEITKVT